MAFKCVCVCVSQVDFVDAVTNFDNPDTVPDMLARHGSSSSAPPAKEDPATPHASPATLSRQTSRANPDITTPNTTPTNSATAGPSAAAMQREIARSVDAWCEASASPKKGGVGVGGGGGKVAGDTRQASAFAAGAAPAGVADARGDTPPLGAMAALCKELSGALLTGQPSGTPECPDLTEDTPATEFYGYQVHTHTHAHTHIDKHTHVRTCARTYTHTHTPCTETVRVVPLHKQWKATGDVYVLHVCVFVCVVYRLMVLICARMYWSTPLQFSPHPQPHPPPHSPCPPTGRRWRGRCHRDSTLT